MPELLAAGARPCAATKARVLSYSLSNCSSKYQIFPMVFLTPCDWETVFENARRIGRVELESHRARGRRRREVPTAPPQPVESAGTSAGRYGGPLDAVDRAGARGRPPTPGATATPAAGDQRGGAGQASAADGHAGAAVTQAIQGNAAARGDLADPSGARVAADRGRLGAVGRQAHVKVRPSTSDARQTRPRPVAGATLAPRAPWPAEATTPRGHLRARDRSGLEHASPPEEGRRTLSICTRSESGCGVMFPTAGDTHARGPPARHRPNGLDRRSRNLVRDGRP
jgi:hypothetical protein